MLRRLSCALKFVRPSSSYVPTSTCTVPVSAARDLSVSIWSSSRRPLASRLRCWASSIRQTETRRLCKHCSNTQRNSAADALRLITGRAVASDEGSSSVAAVILCFSSGSSNAMSARV